jgi:voltage-gated potassium channel
LLGDWVTFFLALLLIPVLLVEETSTDLSVVRAATAVNAAIWLLFVLDYAVDLWQAADRRGHIARHWADLALIVVSPPLFVPPEAQALRALRAARLFRALAVAGVVAERLGRPLTRSAALVLVGLLAAVVIAGGVLVFVVEPGTFPNVAQGYAWALATLMTAGHSEPVPVTAAGRAISTLIVVMGLGTFAALAASIASTKPLS